MRGESGRRPVALITGASSGIGAAFARHLAGTGHDVVMTARRREKLGALAAQLRARSGGQTHVVVTDLADPDAPGRIQAAVDGLGLPVDFLVNAAGALLSGRLCDRSWDAQLANIRLMALAPCELMHRFLGPMVERRRGSVLNVTSMSVAWPSSPGYTFYAASKAFVLRATRSAAAEYAGSGVRLAAVSPGITRTELLEEPRTARLTRWVPPPLIAAPEHVVRAGLRALDQGRSHAYARRSDAAVSWLLERWAPRDALSSAFARWMLSPDSEQRGMLP